MSNKMDASKENAKKAVDELTKLSDALGEEVRTKLSSHLIFLQEFVAAAERRLPSQKAIDKDKLRKKNYGKNRKSTKKPKTAAEPPAQAECPVCETPVPVGV